MKHWKKNITSLIQQLILDEPAESKKNEILKSIRTQLIDPRFLLEIDILAESHPIKQDTLLLLDAFASITNGMLMDHSIELLHNISRESLLFSWKSLALAIKSLYEKNSHQFYSALSEIEKETPPALLVPVLEDLFNPKEKKSALQHKPLPLRQLVNQLQKEITTWKEDIKEAENLLEIGDITSALFIIQSALTSAAVSDISIGRAIFLKMLNTFVENEFEITDLTASANATLGETLTLQLIAGYYTQKRRPESIIAWFDYLSMLISAGQSSSEDIIAVLSIIRFCSDQTEIPHAIMLEIPARASECAQNIRFLNESDENLNLIYNMLNDMAGNANLTASSTLKSPPTSKSLQLELVF